VINVTQIEKKLSPQRGKAQLSPTKLLIARKRATLRFEVSGGPSCHFVKPALAATAAALLLCMQISDACAAGDDVCNRISLERSQIELDLQKSPNDGAEAMIDGLPRSASVQAVRDCSPAFISRAAFTAMLRRHPELHMDIMATLAVRLRQSDEDCLQFPDGARARGPRLASVRPPPRRGDRPRPSSDPGWP
jgi:hypothetical protein